MKKVEEKVLRYLELSEKFTQKTDRINMIEGLIIEGVPNTIQVNNDSQSNFFFTSSGKILDNNNYAEAHDEKDSFNELREEYNEWKEFNKLQCDLLDYFESKKQLLNE